LKINRYLNQINKKKKNIIIFFLFLFAAYSSITIGQSWDEAFHLLQGKITADYLVTFGYIDNPLYYREYYSPIYFSFTYLITNLFPNSLEIQINHLINTTISFTALFGLAKITRKLFNKKTSYFAFLILFFYPIFFGHMGINSKDIILATCHVWITYLTLSYLKKQDVNASLNKYIICISILAAIGSGIQLLFLGTFMTIFFFVLADIFFLKKFSNVNFDKFKFLIDLLKCFMIFYFLLVLFWIDVHPNILVLPFEIVAKLFADDYLTGWSYNLVNGNYSFSNNVPKTYFLINIFFKTPIYIIVLYCFFVFILFFHKSYFKIKFKHHIYKLLFILSIIIFPNFLIIFLTMPIYDGIRLFLWSLPYLVIIPSLTLSFLIDNSNLKISKISFLILPILIVYFIYNFLLITPYQYTYLNLFAGKAKNNYKKFENDYWGTSAEELIKNMNFKKNYKTNVTVCGFNHGVVKRYLKKHGYNNLTLTEPEKAKYIFMTNRTLAKEILKTGENNITNCFEKYVGIEIATVKRNGKKISVIREIN
jgi:hypothetical protein